ncbi:arginyltransferase [Campylobacter sp. MIT 12-8780]|uniref:arginyltransferase n=1 Tax=unclassified Campylobacter TaxID=2593542 RepID=UPI0010F78B63|nr:MULTISPECIES: arginyltransferase [unclassified Campylobacter]NDJ26938.1 arginyltransferase [Campylobacter sp. MIT 19-121]TKX29106.1 arginyltransferase [Campylobacter sp. MIT 12-5580]TQR41920.1 arginyltransferase [Campylobacter sp. MIT 12-8780]
MRQIGFCTLEDECPYLESKRCKMEYKFIENCSKELNFELVNRGWRRFGAYFSRPICSACNECLGLRIKASEFRFSKSYRRVINKNTHTQIYLKKPQLSNEHLYLYEKYHRFMGEKRSWKVYNLSFRQYYNLYVDEANDYGFELDFYVDKKLVCVDLIDIFEGGISSIYCFYDPEYAHLSLGKFSLLTEIKLAQNRGLEYIYLGYFVKGCQSLSYKADYSPSEILKQTSPLAQEAFLWEDYNANRSKSRFN